MCTPHSLTKKLTTMKKLIFMSSVLVAALFLNTLQATAQSEIWRNISESDIPKNEGHRTVHPKKYRTVELDVDALKHLLSKAPMEFTRQAQISPVILSIPMPSGEMQRFSIVEYSMMPEELAAKYPEIKNYRGNGMDDPDATIYFGLNSFGFHAIILSGNLQHIVQIDPYVTNTDKYYLSYSLADKAYFPHNEKPFEAQLKDAVNQATLRIPGPTTPTKCFFDTLRTYRLAVTCTGEYAATVCTGNGVALTKANVMSAIDIAITRVNAVYAKELSIRLAFVTKQDTLVFTNAATDPFVQDTNANLAMAESQHVIDSLIGNTHYDLGHMFITSDGGVVQDAGVVCRSGFKAQAVTGQANPLSDTFYVGYVAHEMGHQFGANHTWNSPPSPSGSCPANQRNGPTAVEPGSGVTIMSYQGLCGAYNNIEPHQLNLPNFHVVSLHEMYDYIKNTATCGQRTATGNANPVVVVPTDTVVVPVNTPFTLTGNVAGATTLNYSWEEVDAGTAARNWDAGFAPFFRSYAPSASGNVRTFPKSGPAVKGETMPTTAQVLNFRLTVRDSRNNIGGTCASDKVKVKIVAGQFRVTSQTATPTNWVANGVNTATITWDKGNTHLAPISCDSVEIYFSADSGATYPTTLLAVTLNNGTADVLIPSIATTKGKVKVKGRNRTFFAVNTGLITITICPKPTVSVKASDTAICGTKKITFTATGTNLTATPIYQWKKNGANVGTNAATYIDSTLANTDTIWVVVTSNEACKITKLLSNKVIIKVKVVRPIALACPLNSVCVGGTVTMIATPAGGVWINGGRVRVVSDTNTGGNSAITFTNSAAGTTTIKYTVTDSGCTNSASCNITIAPAPIPSIAYAAGTNIPSIRSGSNFCANRTFTVVGSPNGGVWSATGVVSISPAGLVTTGAAAGAGAVRYTYTDASNCSAYREIASNVVICSSRGIAGTGKEFVVYPNPAKNVIYLNLETLTNNGRVVITDLYGKQVKQQSLSLGNNTVDVSKLSRGVYMISVITQDGKQTQKILID